MRFQQNLFILLVIFGLFTIAKSNSRILRVDNYSRYNYSLYICEPYEISKSQNRSDLYSSGFYNEIKVGNYSNASKIYHTYLVMNFPEISAEEKKNLETYVPCTQEVAENQGYYDPNIEYIFNQISRYEVYCGGDYFGNFMNHYLQKFDQNCDINTKNEIYVAKEKATMDKFCLVGKATYTHELACDTSGYIQTNKDNVQDTASLGTKQFQQQTQYIGETCYIYYKDLNTYDRDRFWVQIQKISKVDGLFEQLHKNKLDEIKEQFQNISDTISDQYVQLKQAFDNFGKCFVNYFGNYNILKPIVRSNPFIKDFDTFNPCDGPDEPTEQEVLLEYINATPVCRYSNLYSPDNLNDVEQLRTSSIQCNKELIALANSTECKQFIQKSINNPGEVISGESLMKPILFIISSILLITLI